LSSWERWFKLDQSELTNWSATGLRHTVHDRRQNLLVTPLVEKIKTRMNFSLGDDIVETLEVPCSSSNRVLDLLVAYFNTHVKPVYTEAKKEDDQLQKKIRKTEKDERKAGMVALGMQDTKKVAALKRQRPAIWEQSQKALGFVEAPVKKLSSCFEDEVSSDMVARTLIAVPAITSRAVCDWHYQKCALDFDQLDKWWENFKTNLQNKTRFWNTLEEREGLLLKRINKAVDEVRLQRSRYPMYATFGGSQAEVLKWLAPANSSSSGGDLTTKLEESLTLLANVVSDMYRRVRIIRDSALWRVLESAQSLHEELRADAVSEIHPWDAIPHEEGTAALLSFLGEGVDRLDLLEAPQTPSSRKTKVDASTLEDITLVVMSNLERLITLAVDLKAFLVPFAKPDPG